MYKLYRIVNTINNNCYIGMTKMSLTKRFSAHKQAKLLFGISTTHYYRLKKQFESNELK